MLKQPMLIFIANDYAATVSVVSGTIRAASSAVVVSLLSSNTKDWKAFG